MKIKISPDELGEVIDAIKRYTSNYTSDMTAIYKSLACLEQDVSNLKNQSEAPTTPPDSGT